MKEWWQPIIENPKYAISSFGRVKHLRLDKIVNQRKSPDGYSIVGLNFDGKTRYKYVGRLVAIHFLEKPENKDQVNHKDGIKTNNFVENLEWCDQSHNIRHAFKLGLIKRHKGEDNHLSKLTKVQVKKIRKMRKLKYTYKEIANKFNVSISCINHIIRGSSWKNVL